MIGGAYPASLGSRASVATATVIRVKTGDRESESSAVHQRECGWGLHAPEKNPYRMAKTVTLATDVVPNMANISAKQATLQNASTLKIPTRGTNKFGTILPGNAAALIMAICAIISRVS